MEISKSSSNAVISMDKFVTSIKKKYRDRLINHEEQWPPCHSSKLVRLELVEQDKGEGYFANQQRGKEDKDVKRTPLAYGDLFKVESGKRPVRKVLVEGDAGIGKTTLCTSVSEDWANEKLFQQFELLLLLPLRMKAVASAGSLPELLKLLHSSSTICNSVASYLEEEEGENVLIIADGWDELSVPERQKESFIHQLLFQTFPLMSVVLTSRPSASAQLHRLPCIDRFVEVRGFSKDNIKEYIHSEFPSDQEKASRLLEQLESNPLVESVCSVPLNCAIVCHLWHTLEEALPTTMTELYTKIILNIILRNIRKVCIYSTILGLSNFDALPEGLQQSWWLLCEFGFRALEKDKIVFSKEELVDFFPQGLALDEKILCFGLLQSTESILDVGCGVSFHFLHLTFQEYLAALHLAKQPPDKQLKVFQSYDPEFDFFNRASYFNYKKRFAMVSRFFFGIYYCDFKMETKFLNFKQAIRYVIGTCVFAENYLPGCHCAFESKNNLITDEVVQLIISNQFFSDVIGFGDPRTAHDCAAILHVIANMQKCSKGMKIDFDNIVRDNQIRILTEILADKQQKLQFEILNVGGNKLADKTLGDLFHRALAAFQSLKDLNLSGNRIGVESIKFIATAMAKSPSNRLSKLDLSHNPLGDSGLQALEDAVHGGSLANLKQLKMQGSLTGDADVDDSLLEALSSHCPLLGDLDLSENNLGVLGASAIAKIISQHSTPNLVSPGFGSQKFELSLNMTNLGDEGLIAFVESLEGPCHLDQLQLMGNGIHATGVLCLSDSICSEKIVVDYLHLGVNPLGLEGTVVVGKMLSRSLNIQFVNLSLCQLTTAGGGTDNVTGELVRDVGQQLCQMPQNNNITSLRLDGNSFTGEGIHVLAGFMHLCPCLHRLYSSHCRITSDDLKQIFALIKVSCPCVCNKLEFWNLGNNEIGDSGVSVLMDHLPSLFPFLGHSPFFTNGIDLYDNPVSSEMMRRVREEMSRRNEAYMESLGKQFHNVSVESHSESTSEEELLSLPASPPLLPSPMAIPTTITHPVNVLRPYSPSIEQLETLQDENSSNAVLEKPPPALKQKFNKGEDFSGLAGVEHHLVDLLEWKDENGDIRELKIYSKIAHMWRQIATRLGFELGEIESVEEENHHRNHFCVTTVLRRWFDNAMNLPNASKYPKSWQGLSNLLEDAELGEVAMELHTALSSPRNSARGNL